MLAPARSLDSATSSLVLDPRGRLKKLGSAIKWWIPAPNATYLRALSRLGGGPLPRNRRGPGRVAGLGQEPDEIVARDRRRHGVDQRVKVEDRVRHQGGVEHDRHPAVRVVERPERRDGAGFDPEGLAHQLGRPEGEPSAGAEPAMQGFELDRRILERAHQIKAAALVLEKEVLAVAAGDLPAQRPALLDREQRRMGAGRGNQTVRQGWRAWSWRRSGLGRVPGPGGR